MRKALLFIVILTSPMFGQVGIGTTSPNAALDITATNDGLLLPRIALNNTTTATVTTPTVSELVYNTATAGDVTPGFYYWDGTKWVRLSISSSTSSNDWALLGNAGTTAGTNFIGTTDNQDLIFKRNNIQSGKISTTNTSLGVNSLAPATSRNRNTAIGTEAMYLNVNGDDNTAIGYQALRTGTDGARNVAIGNNTLMVNTGNDNIAVGMQSLQLNTTGNNNVAVGRISLYSNTSGSDNSAFGTQSLQSNTTGNSNVAVGRNSLYSNTSGYNNSAFGMQSLNSNTTGFFNTALGYNALSNVTTGSNNIGIGNNAQVPVATDSNQVRIGDTSITYAGIQVAWTTTSDERWKDNIQPSNLGLSFINQLKPVSYTRKNDVKKSVEYGFIAQELQASLQKFGVENAGIISTDDNGMLGVRYNDLLAPMILATQEQQKQILEQQKQILELQKLIIEMKEKLDSLNDKF